MNIVVLLSTVGAILSAVCLLISIALTLNAYKNRNEKSGDHYIKDNFLSSDGVFDALHKLNTFVKSTPPDFVVGVNSGGGFIGAYICAQLGINDKNLQTWLVSDRGGMLKLSSPGIKNLYGSVLVVNDMVRSGRTNQIIISALKGNSKVDSITTVSLFKFVEKENHKITNDLDYCAYELTSKNVHLPWTTREKTARGTMKKRIELFRRVRRQSIRKSNSELLTYLDSSNYQSQS